MQGDEKPVESPLVSEGLICTVGVERVRIIFSTHRQCTGCRMQRTYAFGAARSIPLLCLAHLRLIRGRIPCKSPAPGNKYARTIHPSAMTSATEHAEIPKNKLALSSSPYLKQHETNPVRICVPGLTCIENLVALDACQDKCVCGTMRSKATLQVDWYSWGEEAFQKARSEDKPIFLSVGYSTCHW